MFCESIYDEATLHRASNFRENHFLALGGTFGLVMVLIILPLSQGLSDYGAWNANLQVNTKFLLVEAFYSCIHFQLC